MFRINTYSKEVALQDYLVSIGTGYCPYLLPSLRKGLLYFSRYSLREPILEELQKSIFYYGLLHTEIFRHERKNLPLECKKLLICENVIFNVPKEYDHDGDNLLSLPHWCLKVLYLNAGILYGKFWIGEKLKPADGRDVPIPSIHFISIRSAIKEKDRRFFTKANNLLPEFEKAEDNDQNVFSVNNINIDPDTYYLLDDVKNNYDNVIIIESAIRKLKQSSLYEIVLEFGRKRLSELKLK